MILTQKEIIEKNLFKKPLDKFQLQMHAVDLRLGTTFIAFKDHMMMYDAWAQAIPGHDTVVHEMEAGQVFVLMPGQHVNACTLDEVQLTDDVMAVVYPRSTSNRRGLTIDATGIVDAGYAGPLVIPITNNTLVPIALVPGERIASLVFQKLSEPVVLKQSSYHNRDVADGAILNKDDEREMLAKGEIQALKDKYAL